MSMPDKWEYPWFAAWDLAFHCISLAHLDPAFAKYQLILLCREWFQHPNGALPAYEWDFGDVNPPVQAWAALEVFAIDGGRDLDFLSRILDKLMINFTWWVNREDADGNNLFEGGFLGLDNIGPIDRSHLPAGDLLQQADATGWMGFYALTLAGIAAILNRSRQPADRGPGCEVHRTLHVDLPSHRRPWTVRRRAGNVLRSPPFGGRDRGNAEGALHGGSHSPACVGHFGSGRPRSRRTAGKGFASFYRGFDREALRTAGVLRGEPGDEQLLLGMVGIDQFLRLVARMFDESEFLSPYGLRALSAYHREARMSEHRGVRWVD